MGRFWEFLRNEQNRLVLGWLGGGLVVAATGAWAAFIYFFPLHKAPEPPPAATKAEQPAPKVEPPSPNVKASGGSVVIGRDAIGTTINTGGPAHGEGTTKSK
jgi:hypothetical protein